MDKQLFSIKIKLTNIINETAENIRRRVDNITSNPDNNPAIANVTGTSVNSPKPVPAPQVDHSDVVRNLEANRTKNNGRKTP